MLRSITLAWVALAATAMLAAGIADAREFSITNQTFRATWRSLEFRGGEIVIRCPLTLEGNFHARGITKVARNLIGQITRGIVKQESCTNGRVAIFNGVEVYNGTVEASSLPWHLTYESFTGTLPSITSIRFLFSRFLFGVRDNLGACTGRYGIETDNVTLSAARAAGGEITTLTPVAMRNLFLLLRRDGGVLCPEIGAVAESGEVFVLGSTVRITVTLI